MAAALHAWAAPPGHSNALWHVVHDLCVPDRRLLGLPLPCSRVDLRAGYVILPDPGGADQVLLAPTRRVVGIEDPFLLQPDAPNYWQYAWQARDLLARRLRADLPREAVAMAVNAEPGRSQEQLHIHVSCISSDVAQALKSQAPELGQPWSSIPLDGESWRARSVAGEDLAANNPFKLYADASPSNADLSKVTLVVAAIRLPDGAPGFALLARTADASAGYRGHGEELLDETCRSVRRPAAGA